MQVLIPDFQNQIFVVAESVQDTEVKEDNSVHGESQRVIPEKA